MSDPAGIPAHGGGQMRRLVHDFDWASTALGPAAAWPAPLRTAAAIVLNAVQPMVLFWGPDLVQIYNDAFAPALGVGRHPAALGQRAAAFWQENWSIIGPQVGRVLRGEGACWFEDNFVPIQRNGRVEECYWTYTFTPVPDDDGAIPGILVVCHETTARVLAERRRKALDGLAAGLHRCRTVEEVWEHARQAAALAPNDIRSIQAGGEPAPGQVSLSPHGLELANPLVLHVGISPDLPFDQLYRQFLEQFSQLVGGACLRIEREAAENIATAERNRLLLDAPVAAAVMIGEDLVYDLVNSLYTQVSGRDAADMVGKPFVEVFPELAGSSVRASFLQVYRSGQPYVSEETLVPIHRHGGALEDRYFTYNVAPLRRLDGSVYGIMVIAVDITPQVCARSQIERLNAELKAAANAKDEFLALLGHELRNPLAPIVTALDLMELRQAPSGREQAVIRRQVRHLTRLVDDLLDVSRITRGKVELRKATVPLRDVLARAVEMASHLIEQKKQYLSVDVPELDWHGDPARLAQVVANLLTNAARYTPEHGHIWLDARAAGGQVTLQVRDDGMGMSETLLPHVFEAFVQGERKLDGAVGGLGIGLALVRNLVEMHGGVASAYSAGPGQGSTFTVILPLGLPEAAAAPEPAAPVVEGAGAAALPVLVVDDNRDGADFLADLLRSMGYAVTFAYDPAQALQEAARAMPAVAILDIGLPGMNGYELAEHMRRLPQGAAVVFVALTGYGQHDDKLRSRASGFAGHLVKPVGVDELQAVLLRLTTAGGRP